MHYAIIAAGQGSRLQQEGISVPKPLVRLNGSTMIERLIHIFTSAGATSISVIVNEDMPEVKDTVKSMNLTIPLEVISMTTPGSMHSFSRLSDTIKGDRFCLSTVDTVFGEEEFHEYIHAFESDESADGYMAVTSFIDDEKPLYVTTEKANWITGFSDTYVEDVKYVSGGIYLLSRDSLRILDRCMQAGATRMRDFQRALIAQNFRLKAFPFKKIVDVDHISDIGNAVDLITSS
ncbi:MAG: NTP transferase domain-containing protein [Duncaniella sp.]|nr:NTP transferase domain-containing protein [Muribaculum sp.]MCM1255164.1 NTP transferase domain-containing protein [Duncaniella sp.]